MKEIIKGVEVLAMAEMENANGKFPMFRSTHEGYAIIKEEYEEAITEIENVRFELDGVWSHTKRNDKESAIAHVERLQERAIHLAAESIQIIAMAQKYLESKL